MVHEFMALEAWMNLAAASVAGCCGLLMCRAMLRCPTASSLRAEAAISMIRQGNAYCLNSHQLAAVSLDLFECGTPPERSIRLGPFPGLNPHQKPAIE